MFKNKYILVVMLLFTALLWAEQYIYQKPNLKLDTEIISIPKILNYQGKLTNLTGNPVNDSTYSITFRLFTNSSGGSSFWNETQNVTTSTGIFNVLLGSTTQIESIPQAGNCYLEMQVNPNPAMTPRIRLVSSAYAYLAKKADSADYVRNISVNYVDSSRVSTNSYKLQGKDTVALSNKYVDEGQISSISSGMITDGVIQRVDVISSFKAPYADTSDYTRYVNIAYVDSARIATNSYKLQGKDTIALSNKFIDEGQVNAISNAMLQSNTVTSTKIQDSTITRADVTRNFKSPYADTSDYARGANVMYVDSSRVSVNAYNAHKLQGKDTTALSTKFIDEGQLASGDLANTYPNPTIAGNAVTSSKILNGTIMREDVITNFKSPYADTADYSRYVPGAIDSARVAANAHQLQGKDTNALSSKFIDEGQASSISSTMIMDNAITRNDATTDFKAPYADTADYVRNLVIAYIDSSRISTNSYKLQGKDTTALSIKFVDEGQLNSITNSMLDDNAVTSGKIQDGTIQVSDLGFTPVSRPFTPLISGTEIALPCTLEATFPVYGDIEMMNKQSDGQHRDNKRLAGNAVFNVKNNGTGDGIKVINAGGEGINIEHANGAGIAIGSAEQDGLNIGTANWAGIYIWKTAGDGIYIDSAGNDGVVINKATTNGTTVIDALNIGNYVQNSGTDAFVAHRAGDNGLRVTHAASDGVFVDSAGNYGVDAYGEVGGIYGRSNNGYGVRAQSTSGMALKVEGTSEFTGQITSTASVPISVTSTAVCPNLNADLLDGQHASSFMGTSSDYGRSGVATDLYEGTTTLTNKYVNEGQANAINSGMIADNSIRGDDIAKPCSLVGNISYPGPILNLKRSGIGVYVDTVNYGFFAQNAYVTGLYVGRSQHGVYISRTGVDGVYIDSAADVGFYVNRADTGLKIMRARYNGICIDSAGGAGVYIDSVHYGVHVERAVNNGYYVNNSGAHGYSTVTPGMSGLCVGNAGQYGVNIIRASLNGVNISCAGDNGIYIDSVADVGFFVNRADTGLRIVKTNGDGIYIDSTTHNGVRVISSAGNGVSVDNANIYGFYADRAHNALAAGRTGGHGIYLYRTGDNGVHVDSAADIGFYVNRCDTGFRVSRANSFGYFTDTAPCGYRINKASQVGMVIRNSNIYGIYIDSSGDNGMYIYRTGTNGLKVDRANDNGVLIDSAADVGFYVNQCDTGFRVKKAERYGLVVDTAFLDGLYVNQSNSNAVKVNRTGTGLYVNRATGTGVYVDSAGFYGLRVKYAANEAVYIDSSGNNGVYVKGAYNTGVFVYKAAGGMGVGRVLYNGMFIGTAGQNGVVVDSVGTVGFYVNRCDTGLKIVNPANNGVYIGGVSNDGIYIDNASNDAININYAGNNGVWVSGSSNYGVNAAGATAGGYFEAFPNAAAEGVIAAAYNNVATDTAIYARGKGVATGGWGSTLKGGEGYSIVNPNRTIIAYGTGQVRNKSCNISFDKMFTDNIKTDVPISVNLTPRGNPTGILVVSETDASGFGVTLKEIPGWSGDDNIEFNWTAFAELKEPVTSAEDIAEWERMNLERERNK